jgi:predicted amidohydrolase
MGVLTGADARHLAAAAVLGLDGIDALVLPLALEARPLADPPPESELAVWPGVLASLLRCHVFAVDRIGSEDGRVFAGGSRAFGPTGALLVEGDDETEGLFFCRLDHDATRRARLTGTGPRDEARDVVLRELRRALRER